MYYNIFMSALIYIFLILICFVGAFLILKFRMAFLSNHTDKYDSEYDGHAIFLDLLFKSIRYYSRRASSYFKFIKNYVLHIFVLITLKFKNTSDKLYAKSRDEFMKEVIKNKKTVPHFWSHLKKYKKEKDEENRIDDISINTL